MGGGVEGVVERVEREEDDGVAVLKQPGTATLTCVAYSLRRAGRRHDGAVPVVSIKIGNEC